MCCGDRFRAWFRKDLALACIQLGCCYVLSVSVFRLACRVSLIATNHSQALDHIAIPLNGSMLVL